MRYDEYNANENLSGSPLYNTLQVTVAVRRPSGAIVEKMGSAELFISNSEKDYFGLNCVFSKEAKENILKCDFTARLYDESKEEYQYTEITIPEMTVTYRDLVTSQ